MLFDQNAPLSQVALPPSYYQGDPTKLKLLGFNPDGTRNTWGQILGWHPQMAAASNILANREFSATRATDSLANQQMWAQRDLNKSMMNINAGLTVAGALSGSPQLATQGATGLAKGFGGLINPVQSQQPQRISYLNPYNY